MPLPNATSAFAPIIEKEEPNHKDRREADRQMSVLLTAKISGNGYETFCRVHNISVNGAKIETLVTLQSGDSVCIEFRSDIVADGIVRWAKQGMAGVEFSSSINVGKILKRSDVNIARTKPRPPRYKCDARAEIEMGKAAFDCDVIDISITGAKLRGVRHLRMGDILFVQVSGLSKHSAKVVWQRGDEAGVRLVNPFRYDEIEWWLFLNVKKIETSK